MWSQAANLANQVAPGLTDKVLQHGAHLIDIVAPPLEEGDAYDGYNDNDENDDNYFDENGNIPGNEVIHFDPLAQSPESAAATISSLKAEIREMDEASALSACSMKEMGAMLRERESQLAEVTSQLQIKKDINSNHDSNSNTNSNATPTPPLPTNSSLPPSPQPPTSMRLTQLERLTSEQTLKLANLTTQLNQKSSEVASGANTIVNLQKVSERSEAKIRM